MIEGYQFLQSVSTRSSTRVFHALDETSGQEVALKLVEVLDEGSRIRAENLLHCAETLQRQPHPNLCPVLEFGKSGPYAYVAYPWLRPFNLLQALAKGLNLVQIKRIFTGLAHALQHLEESRIVHGDIKPENILLDHDFEPVLIDVSGGALAAEKLRATTRTLGYSSPEADRGESIDARSDAYSFAITLYRTLVGNVPWVDGNGVGRTTTEEDTVPRLAVEFAALQPIIDSCLSFDPRDRNLDQEGMAKAFDSVVAIGAPSSSIVRSDLVRSSELEDVELGDTGPDGTHFVAYSRRYRVLRVAVATVGSILLIAGIWMGYVERHSIQEFFSGLGIVEHPEFEERWRTAVALQSDANQSLSAITAAYNRVLEVSPNHQGARLAIGQVRSDWKTQISQFIESNELVLAQSRLNELARVYPEDEGIDTLSQQLYRMSRADRLLDDTRHLQDLRGTDDQEALTAIIRAYKQLVRLHPDHPESEEAQSQLNALSKSIADMSLDATKRGNLPLARDLLGLAVEANPASADLRSAQEELQQAQSLKEEIEGTLQIAAKHREEGKLIAPVNQNAYASFRRVLELDADNQVAINGLAEVVVNVMFNLTELLDQQKLDEAVELIESARTLGVSQDSLEELEALHSEELQRIAQARFLYDEAVELYQEGYITRPQSGNALYKLRQAQLLDPRNYLVSNLLDQCAGRIAEVARDAHNAGMAEDARYYLNIALEIQSPNPLWESWRDDWFPGEEVDAPLGDGLEEHSAVTVESANQL